MAKARNKGLLVELMNGPWWLSLLLAVAVYIACTLAPNFIQFNSPVSAGLNGLVQALPNLAPFFGGIFVFVAAAALVRSKFRQRLLDKQSSIESLRDLSWRDFEKLVGEAYRRKGYSIEETGLGGADGGIDLRLHKDGELSLVQCKQWKKQKIGVAPIRELLGLKVAENAQAAIFVCIGEYTKEAIEFASKNQIALVNGAELFDLVSTVQKDSAPVAQSIP